MPLGWYAVFTVGIAAFVSPQIYLLAHGLTSQPATSVYRGAIDMLPINEARVNKLVKKNRNSRKYSFPYLIRIGNCSGEAIHLREFLKAVFALLNVEALLVDLGKTV